MVADMADRVSLHEKARAEQLVADARAALNENAPVDKIRALASDLEQMMHILGTSTNQYGDAPVNGDRTAHSDDVVDAEFTEKR